MIRNPKKVSIGIGGRINRDFEKSLLNAVALKKFKEPYENAKTEVNLFVKETAQKHNTTVSTDIKMLLMFELVSSKDKKILMALHEDEITKSE